MELTIKEIELVNLGTSIAAGCKPCTSYHLRKVKKAEASEKEIMNAITVSVGILEAAKSEMNNYAVNLLGKTKQDNVTKDKIDYNRIDILISIGAAFATNCTLTLNKYIVLGKLTGITNNVLNKVFKAAKPVKMEAASHVDNIAIRFEGAESSEKESDDLNSCGCEKNESNVQIKSNDSKVNIENSCC